MTRPFNNYKTIKVSCPDQNGFEVLVRIKTKKILPIKNNFKNTKKFKSIKLKRAIEKNDVIELSDLDLVISNKSSNNSFYNNKKDLRKEDKTKFKNGPIIAS